VLQLLKKEFDEIDVLIKYVNEISIKYGYLKDYELLKQDNKFIVIMRFDVPGTKQFLELANLKKDMPDNPRKAQCIYRVKYNIKLEDESRDTDTMILFNDVKNGLEVNSVGGIKALSDLLFRIKYDNDTCNFKIELSDFKFESYVRGWYTEITETLLVTEIDYKIIYYHLVKLMFNRGYLFDWLSLESLKDTIYYNVHWLSKRDFKNFN